MSRLLLVVNTFTVLIKSGGAAVLNASLKGSSNGSRCFVQCDYMICLTVGT